MRRWHRELLTGQAPDPDNLHLREKYLARRQHTLQELMESYEEQSAYRHDLSQVSSQQLQLFKSDKISLSSLVGQSWSIDEPFPYWSIIHQVQNVCLFNVHQRFLQISILYVFFCFPVFFAKDIHKMNIDTGSSMLD